MNPPGADSIRVACGSSLPLCVSAVGLLLLSALFLKPLIALARLALAEDLYSHVLLIPLVSAYLIWLKRPTLHAVWSSSFSWRDAQQSPSGQLKLQLHTLAPLIFGTIVLACWLIAPREWTDVPVNSTSLLMLSYVSFIWAISMAAFGWTTIRPILFPVAFLVFVVPFPAALTHQIESFFQHTSASAASLLFGISQTSVLRDGLFFKLPGLTIEVARECSGIRSTLVLFITSLVGGYMFFNSGRSRLILALAIIPIAIIRNAFRIFTIAMLCVHVDPGMIDSTIHRRGGPLFFALSLVPFFALLIFLRRRQGESEKVRK